VSSRKIRTFWLLTILSVTLIVISLFEIGLRVYHLTRHRHRYIWIPDRYLGYIHTTNNQFTHHYTEEKKLSVAHQTNSLGLIGEEVSIEKADDTYRIIILGDSYTEAFQVPKEKNFCGLLEKLLEQDLNSQLKDVEVLNAGVSGYSPIKYYLAYQRELAKLNPDLVMVQLFANDVFEDNVAKAKSIIDEEGLPVQINRYFKANINHQNRFNTEGLEGYSKSYSFVKFLVNRSRIAEYLFVKIINRGKSSSYHQKMIRKDEFGTGNQFFIIDPTHHLNKDEEFRRQTWNLTQNYLLSLKSLVESHNAKFYLFYIPLETQIKLDHYGQHTMLYSQKYVGTFFNKILNKFSQMYNISYLDLLPTFEREKSKKLYLNRDGHLTPTGHATTARALYDDLKDKNILPRRENTVVSAN